MKNSMENLRNNLHLLLLAAALIATSGLVVACGGGGGGGGGGAAVATQSLGEITAKGSVTVNGVKFETTGATIVMDGATPAIGDDSKLRIGMAVAVEGAINDDGVTGNATRITFDDTMQGPVTTKNADDTLLIMGKAVVVTPDTVISRFDDSVGGARTLDDILVNGMVEVSGGVDDLGRVVATHIELKPAGEISEVTGKVEPGSALVVSGVIVTTTGATTFPNFPAGTTAPAVGNMVEVKGSFNGTSLAADSIELKTGLQNDDNLHFEGFVLTGGTASSFVVQGNHLNETLTVTTANTIFMGGVKEDLVAGTKVEVEGVLTGTTIAASKVKFKENVRIEMSAGAPDSTREGIELRFLPGVTVITDATTRTTVSGNTSSIIAGADLKIRGRLNRDGSKVIATRVEINDPRALDKLNDAILRGPITAAIGANNSSVTIAGVTVSIPAGTTFRPNDDNGTDTLPPITSADFFAKVKIGTVVKAKGTVSADNVFVATELELED